MSRKEIEVKAKDEFEAIMEGCEKLGVSQDEITLEVLKKGGMFSKGVYLVKIKEDIAKPAAKKEEPKQEPKKAEKKPEPKKIVKDETVRPVASEGATPKATGTKFEVTTAFVTKLLQLLENDSTVTTERTDTAFNINVNGENIGRLIGKNGVVLNAIQTLVSSIAISNANGEGTRVFVNIGDYKEKRGDTLQSLALKKAEKVKETGRYIKLEPMNARDRAIIHTALAEVKGIKTYSTGKDPFRCLCIAPADANEPKTDKPTETEEK